MHDTRQLIKCGVADKDISPLFLGVFPADRIPLFFPVRDWCLIAIANTDPANKGGQHWIALGSRWSENFFSIPMVMNLSFTSRICQDLIIGQNGIKILNNSLVMFVAIGVYIGVQDSRAFRLKTDYSVSCINFQMMRG